MISARQLPNVGTAVFIRRDGKVLLGKRIRSHGVGTWHPPGGYLEMNETWEGCAAREAFEETGLTITNVRFITATNDIFVSEEKHFVTLHLVADCASGEVENKEPDKHDGWGWFSWDSLPQPLFLPVRNFVEGGYNPLTI